MTFRVRLDEAEIKRAIEEFILGKKHIGDNHSVQSVTLNKSSGDRPGDSGAYYAEASLIESEEKQSRSTIHNSGQYGSFVDQNDR